MIKIKNARKSAFLGSALALTIFTSACASPLGNDVTVNLRAPKVEEETKPVIEAVEEATWVTFDDSALMYRVDFDAFLKDKLKLKSSMLENEDIINLIELIHEELGEELFVKEKTDNTLYNLEGKSVTISVSSNRWLYVKFYGDEVSIEYEICVGKNGKTEDISRSIEEDYNKFAKYYVIYSDNKEFTRTICIREDSTKYLSVGLHEGGTFTDPYSISFDSDMGDANVKLSREEYEDLYEIMVSYWESDNLYAFFSDNRELLNKYLDMIKEKSEVYYDYLSSMINKYTSRGKVLEYK